MGWQTDINIKTCPLRSLVLDLSLLHGHEKAVLLVVIRTVWQLIRIRAKLNAVHVGVGYAGQHVLHRYHARWVAAFSVHRLKELYIYIIHKYIYTHIHMVQHDSTSFWKLHCPLTDLQHLNFNETFSWHPSSRSRPCHASSPDWGWPPPSSTVDLSWRSTMIHCYQVRCPAESLARFDCLDTLFGHFGCLE